MFNRVAYTPKVPGVLVLMECIYFEKRGKDKCLSLSYPNIKKESISDKIKYIIIQTNNISNVYYQNYMQIMFNFDHDLSLEKDIKQLECNNIYWTHFKKQWMKAKTY